MEKTFDEKVGAVWLFLLIVFICLIASASEQEEKRRLIP